jgi:tetratricopeptide (TPR) repeat protein
MTDGVFPDRLTQLRARWEADPSSRIFLQLAEEYRHLGRTQEALVVLDRGLKEHPGYLSALVAKGRCHIELGEGEAARSVLERVVKQDATQMVANKLLVRAYLETGDPVKARERLDLYSLLNDSDPEIEELRRRIRQLERPVPAASTAPTDVFDLDAPASPARGGDDIFELAPRPAAPAPAAPPAPPAENLFELEPLAARGPAPAPILAAPFALETPPPPIPAAVASEEDETVVDENLLFPGLSSHDRRRRYLDALDAEGLFAFEPPPAAPAPFTPEPFAPEPFAPEPAPALPDEASWLDEAPEAPPAPAPESLMPAIFAEPSASRPEPEATTAEDLWSEEPAPEPMLPMQPMPSGDDLLPAIDIEAAAEPEPFDLAPPPMPVFEPEPEPEPVMEAPAEPAAPAEEPAEVATATLGDLYFRQGHYAEAERIFREVLEREPGNAAAVAALERIAALGPQPERPQLDARRLLTGYRRDPSQRAEAEARSRKVFLLNRYLDRLRQGSSPDVP